MSNFFAWKSSLAWKPNIAIPENAWLVFSKCYKICNVFSCDNPVELKRLLDTQETLKTSQTESRYIATHKMTTLKWTSFLKKPTASTHLKRHCLFNSVIFDFTITNLFFFVIKNVSSWFCVRTPDYFGGIYWKIFNFELFNYLCIVGEF